MVKAQPDPVPNSVVDVVVVLVVEALVDRLGLLQLSAGVGKDAVVLTHASGHRSHPCLAWFIGADGGARSRRRSGMAST
jgi:hypothetical protein